MTGWDVVDAHGRPVPNPRPGPFTYTYGDLIDEWLEVSEPTVRCLECGWTALLGDWVTDYSPGLVGAPSLTLWNWPELKPEFKQAMLARLGGRSRYLSAHL
jgi:hypothetical protein